MSAGSGTERTWSPSAGAAELRKRAAILGSIRGFFDELGVTEVQTSALGRYGVTDPAIASIRTETGDFLQTSPEYQLKRLLAAHRLPAYQIGPVFRSGESGSWHTREFTMLEWYRPGYTSEELRGEVRSLIERILGPCAWTTQSFQQLLQAAFGDALELHLGDRILAAASEQGLVQPGSIREALEFLSSRAMELMCRACWFVVDYPAEMAALSTVVQRGGRPVADRFELVIDGIEVANGYQELTDPDELVRRFQHDNEARRERGLPAVDIDVDLISAMRAGLPPMAGVALGLDRLVALALGKSSIREVMAFPEG